MQNDFDLLEISLFQSLIRTIITNFKDYPQLVCYFYDDKNKPYYVLLIEITPCSDSYAIFRLDENVTFKLNGHLLEIEQFTSEILNLKHGTGLLNWMRNLRTAYIKMKTEYYQE